MGQITEQYRDVLRKEILLCIRTVDYVRWPSLQILIPRFRRSALSTLLSRAGKRFRVARHNSAYKPFQNNCFAKDFGDSRVSNPARCDLLAI